MKIAITIGMIFFSRFMGTGTVPEMDQSAWKKMESTIKSVFQVEYFTLVPVIDTTGNVVISGADHTVPAFRVFHDDTLVGYAHLSSARGRYENFDFLLLYSTELIIEHVEILVYRSDHGFEIMNKRWLAQFKGSRGCGLVYGKDIDAISGATISGNSLTHTIAEICEKMDLTLLQGQQINR